MFYQGQVLDGAYQIIEEIGQGGTGVVYLAWHLRLQKYIVVKRIKDGFAERANVRVEVDILKSLHHTCLPQVYDFFQLGSEVYTVMDYIEGRSLQSYLNEGYRFEERKLVFWMKQLCSVLIYLHGQKPAIWHSDIKPDNIMITPRGNVCLIDFNVSLDSSHAAQVLGYSQYYAAPEQYAKAEAIRSHRGDDILLDGRMDIYSLGASFYRVITGVVPAGNQEEIWPAAALSLPYSNAFCRIVDKAMAHDRRKRFSSAQALMNALENMYRFDEGYGRLLRKKFLLYAGCGCMVLAGTLLTVYGSARTAGERYEEQFVKFQESVETGNTEQISREGLELLNNGTFEKILEKNTEEKAEIFYQIGNAEYAKENYAEARRYFSYARETNSDEPAYWRDEAAAAIKSGDLKGGNQILRQARREGIDSDNLTYMEAEAAAAAGDWESAAGYAGQLTALPGELGVRACLLQEEILRQNGTAQERAELLKMVMEKEPGILWVRQTALAWLQLAGEEPSDSRKQEYFRQAGACYEEISRRDGLVFEDRVNLAVICEQTGDYEEGIQILEALTGDEREDYRVWMHLACLEYLRQISLPAGERDFADMQQYGRRAGRAWQLAGSPEDPGMDTMESFMREGEEP